METKLFNKKYLGEITLKNGEHVKFLYQIDEAHFSQVEIEAKNIWRKLHQTNADIREFSWALMDNLDFTQFQTVYAGIKIYGKNYWKLVWEHYLEKNKKSI